MNADLKNCLRRFWIWIALAVLVDFIVGVVLGVGALIVLVALTSYAP